MYSCTIISGVLAEPLPQLPVQLGAVGRRVAEHLRRGPVGVAHKVQQALELARLQCQQLHGAFLHLPQGQRRQHHHANAEHQHHDAHSAH